MKSTVINKMSRLYWIFIFLTGIVSSCNQPGDDEPVTTPYELEIPQGLPPMDSFIPLDNPMTVEGVALGRKLFYDPLLSDDNTQACADCHNQQAAFSDPRQFSIGIDGSVGTRNAMALFNLGWNPNGFFWDGRAETLEDLVFEPVTNPIEMNTTWPEVEAKLNANEEYRQLFSVAYGVEEIDSTTVTKAIAQFLRTLISGNSKFDKYYNQQTGSLTDQELRGLVLFLDNDGGDCFHCHSLGGLITTNLYENNGLDSDFSADEGRYLVSGIEADKGRFRIPTLRNIELTAPYMHDGRFFTLEQVVNHYSEEIQWSDNINLANLQFAHVGGVQLTPAEKEDLIAFLKTFTDQEFVNNPDFSNPNP